MKEFLHKIVKIFLILVLITAAITIAVVGVVYFNHQKKLKEEAPLIATPPGQMVEVDGHQMHVYITGKEDAKHTIVFVHGSNMTDDVIAMRPLFDELKEDYRLVYVDRPGNGYSEAGCKDKSVATLTDETRQAIAKAGVEGSVILFAQTTGGIEATYWAEQYPKEVESIIGLDMYSPKEYESDQGEDKGFRYMLYLFARVGIIRHIDSAYVTNSYKLYTDKEILTRNALISKTSYFKDTYLEDKTIGDNARATDQERVYGKLPMLLVFANPLKEPYLSTDSSAKADLAKMQESYPDYNFETLYNEKRLAYFGKYDNVTCVEMAGPSTLYTYDPVGLADQMRKYIEKMN